MTAATNTFDTVVLGAGPAGSGPLVAAAHSGVAAAWLQRGVLWADQGPRMGPGNLGRYAIASDTMAKVLLEALQGPHNPLADLVQHPLAKQLAALGERSVPLSVAADYLAVVGERLEQLVASEPASAFWPGHRAVSLLRRRDGVFAVRFANGRTACGHKVLLALGGTQDRNALACAEVASGVTLKQVPANRLWTSGELFETGGLAKALAQLASCGPCARIVLVGGSHSAICAADLLLRSALAASLPAGAIEVWCRSLPRPFYASVAAAHAEGFSDFGPQDICPVTGRVLRLAGLRMASRDLLRAILGLGGLAREPRVVVRLLAEQRPQQLQSDLARADMVVACLGYRPADLAFRDEQDPARTLSLGASFAEPRVDAACQLLDGWGRPIANAYGIGLASGFVPRGPVLGGEPSFRGQTNGIWMYQHDVGRLLLQRLGVLP